MLPACFSARHAAATDRAHVPSRPPRTPHGGPRILRPLLALAGAALLAAVPAAAADDPAGTLGGRVTDREGRPLRDVVIETSSDVHGVTVRTTSAADGGYRLRLPPATDWVIAVSQGPRFTTMWQDRVVIRAARERRESFALFPSIRETVEVVADGRPLVDLTEVGQRTRLSGDFLRGLPLICGR